MTLLKGEVKEEDLSDAKTLDMLWRYVSMFF